MPLPELQNSYQRIGEHFYAEAIPRLVEQGELLLWNTELASVTGLSSLTSLSAEQRAALLSGQQLFSGSAPWALAYSGHQFGQFNPHMGDGRAHYLGTIRHERGLSDIQLKGSGQTPYTRRGDGLCALGPALREYLMSEALFYLKISTSRVLSVVRTSDVVQRQRVEPGAIVARVASSHIRVGSFQYLASRQFTDELQQLMDLAIERHYPDMKISTDPLENISLFIDRVMDNQIRLITDWMRVGFIHGVMNTDNMAVSGETIDYGPCAMMNQYHPDTVFSSIDEMGRYAFGQQPAIALWNITRLAESLLALLPDTSNRTLQTIEKQLNGFGNRFDAHYQQMVSSKLGFSRENETTEKLARQLLHIMQTKELDYTLTFNQLTKAIGSLNNTDNHIMVPGIPEHWYQQWLAGLASHNQSLADAHALMSRTNPCVIPRNHHVESALAQAVTAGDLTEFNQLLEVLKTPYQETSLTPLFQDVPENGNAGYMTYCGT